MKNALKKIKNKISQLVSGKYSHTEIYYDAETGLRKPVVGSNYVAQWGVDEFTISSLLNGKVETRISVIEKIVSWTSSGNVRQEKTWDVKISNESLKNEDGKKFEIILGNFQSNFDANRELQRSANEILKDFFPAYVSYSSGENFGFKKSVSSNEAYQDSSLISGSSRNDGPIENHGKKSFVRRLATALGPWFGGAAVVILLALIIPASDRNREHTHPHPESNTGMNGPIGSMPALNLNEAAPTAWETLSQDQKDVLLRMSEQAVRDYANRNQPQTSLTKPDAIKSLSEDQMIRLRSLYSLKMGLGEKTFFAFEDPLCSACKDFSNQSRNLPSDFSVVVLPIAFQNGARDIAAAALCAKDPKATWLNVMSSIVGGDKPCDAGYKIIDSNNAAFLDFGFRSTPTLIGLNNSVVVGSMNTSDLTQWVAINGKK